MDIYALLWAAALTLLLFLWAFYATNRYLLCFAMVIATLRAFDIGKYRLYALLVKRNTKKRIRRRIAFALVNFYEVVVAYAILYLGSGQVLRDGHALCSPLAAFYYSLVTMVTLGYGDYTPAKDLTRGIVIMQLVTSLLLLVFIIPALVSIISSEEGDCQTSTE